MLLCCWWCCICLGGFVCLGFLFLSIFWDRFFFLCVLFFKIYLFWFFVYECFSCVYVCIPRSHIAHAGQKVLATASVWGRGSHPIPTELMDVLEKHHLQEIEPSSWGLSAPRWLGVMCKWRSKPGYRISLVTALHNGLQNSQSDTDRSHTYWIWTVNSLRIVTRMSLGLGNLA